MPIEPSEVNRINFESEIKKIEELNQMNKIKIMKDPKQEIKSWLDALSNENVDRESKEMLNKCLQAELHNYLLPLYNIKTEPLSKEKMWGSGVSVLNFNAAKSRYMGDLKASERLKNNSVCVIDNGAIRNIKDNEKLDDLTLVEINNCEKVDKDNDYIEKGENVRYTTL